jgi:2-amino-4-hydroxy-6-hydroxymethyldihydropteridine diphosphokinase
MANVYIGLGTNLGDKKKNITNATILLGSLMGDVKNLSSLYETEPWGFESVNNFLNAVVQIDTTLSPQVCLKMAKAIEWEMGRSYTKCGYEDRIIDVDILMYDSEVVEDEDLKIPHALMHLREFVLKPLAELAPDLVHPVLNKTMEDLLSELQKKEAK